ncbi:MULTISPECIES: hypothetical protein [Lysobacteraceae]|uniref:DUF2007 domain-containing protein n=1 Tax=Novilysobacter avium TaxID=2781023 RepID=A0A7S6UJJ3_9GAMM|nr:MULTISPECIES: hypothetical protein [Lysobacter]QOW21488.1 hypothetical protein INQ42_09550 [Lysobacter avium]QOW23977.1 hypothetical protein INQ43_09620 [Lysobacter sp. H23M47]
MRKVFSSHRLENTEGVAELLRQAGIEVRILNGRSYKGNRRRTFSYSDPSAPVSEAWVVRSDDQRLAREILREAGLIDTTRPDGGYTTPTFRSEVELAQARSPARKKLLRVKLGVLALIAAVVVAAAMHTLNQPPAPAAAPADPSLVEVQTASPPFDGSIAATLPPVARLVLARALQDVDTPVACVGVDRGDAPAAIVSALAASHPRLTVVPATACQEIADEDRGSFERATGRAATIVDVRVFRPAGPEHGTVEVNAYHHRGWAAYETLEVTRVDGTWQVTDVIKRVESRGLMGF